MSHSIFLDGREVQVTVSDLVLNVDDDEFRGNIDYVIAFSESVSSSDVLQHLRLRITSREFRESLDILGHLEASDGFHVTMYWDTLCENNLRDTEIPDDIELVWEDGDVQSMGTFALKHTEAVNPSVPAARESQQAFGQEDMNAIPIEVRVDDFSRGLTIFVRWYNDSLFFILFFSIFWTSFSVYFFVLGDWLPHQVMGSMFSIIGLLLMYYSVCMLMNHTRIDVLNSELTRTYGGPLPCPKRAVSMPVSAIAAVYTRTSTSRTRTNNGKSRRQTSYHVGISTGEGEDVTLAAFSRPEPASFIKQRLEEYLDSTR
jgi:hypothetical protein